MASSSRLVVRDRVHAHPLLSVLPPKKLRGTRYASSQELLFLAFGDRNRASALRGVARSCTKWRGTRDRLHDRSPCCTPLRTVAPHTAIWTQLSRARCGIVRHRRCLNPRVPPSTPSAYSHGGDCVAGDRTRETLLRSGPPTSHANKPKALSARLWPSSGRRPGASAV